MVDVTLIGTGALMPTPERALASVLIKCVGKSILIDCGEGTQLAARKAGVSVINTDIIALTHYHGDHIFGLMGLLQTMNCLDRQKPVYITGPYGLKAQMDIILKLVGETCFDIRLFDVGDDGIKLDKFGFPSGSALKAFKTEHKVVSQGYSFELARQGKFIKEKALALDIPINLWGKLQKGESVEYNGKMYAPHMVLDKQRRGIKVVVTGDSAYCENIIKAAINADLLISEATFSQSEHEALAKEHGHMTFEKAAELALKSNVQKLCLTHFSPRIENPESDVDIAKKIFENTVCGQDGMKLEIMFANDEVI